MCTYICVCTYIYIYVYVVPSFVYVFTDVLYFAHTTYMHVYEASIHTFRLLHMLQQKKALIPSLMAPPSGRTGGNRERTPRPSRRCGGRNEVVPTSPLSYRIDPPMYL